ncbi:hypothetical protein F183_A10740 [Bryobacterales bacterium F-183]|nr:hypothetical protein F183_A10740 [Bryobacterales bacterium F-183]
MSREAYIARTAHDLDHVNRVQIPVFALKDFRLEINGKKSKYHYPEDATPPSTAADTGKDDFHFIPELEEVKIQYEIHDPARLITKAKLELFTNFDKEALWELDLDLFGEDWLAHGKHEIKWDGRIFNNPTAKVAGTKTGDKWEHDFTTQTVEKTKDKFPEGYATLEYPPYKMRLTLLSDDWQEHGDPAWGWTYWHILVKGFEFDLGAKDTIPSGSSEEDTRNQKVWDQIDTDGKIPAVGAVRKVFLRSNIYKTKSSQMATTMDYRLYKKMWGDGPSIPVIAKIRLQDSADAEVKLDTSNKGAVVVGNTQFLWDWEDDPDNKTGDVVTKSAKAKAFVNQAIDYKKKLTDESPKGRNCHVDRGGKRGPDSKPVFPKMKGYDAADALDAGKFPFEVKKAKKRKWAALSKGWSKGALKGCTGVVFQPSRMAGDDYQLAVYLANEWTAKDDRRLDNKDEKLKAGDTIKKKTGKCQIWRKIEVVKYIRKKNSINNFMSSKIGEIQGYFKEAFVEIEDLVDHSELVAANYNALARAQVSAAGSGLLDIAVDPAADHASTAAAFLVRTYADFKTKLRAEFKKADPTATNAELTTAVDDWLTDNNCDTEEKYGVLLDDDLLDDAADALTHQLDLLNGVDEGIVVMHYNSSNSVKMAYPDSAGTNGIAIDVPGNTHQKVVFLLLKEAVDTFVHEIGHHMFLAHFGPSPSSFDKRYHDASDTACIMSYNRPRPQFCGFCVLRLRGWDGDELKAAGGSNTKT